MIHLGAHPWRDQHDHTNLPHRDMGWLVRVGPAPVLGYAFAPGVGDYGVETWAWLHRHGFRQATVRLWLDGATEHDPKPVPLPPREMVRALQQQAIRPLEAGYASSELIYQLDNEPNLERCVMTPAKYAAWALEFVHEWRRVFPVLRITAPPLAQDAPPDHRDTAAWADALRPVVAASDALNIHYYWGRKPGDDRPGAPYSPEWWHARHPDKRILVTECGNAAMLADIAPVLSRWAETAYIDRYHVYIMSSPGWPQWNYTEDVVNVLAALALIWRVRWQLMTAQPPPPSTGDLAWEHVDVIAALAARGRRYVEQAADLIHKAASDYGEIQDRVRMLREARDGNGSHR